ncbi:hypothetical protein OEA41_010291 [Lepraria neglecta]|uniref:Large ribosomal subunit protein bL21m n=1 Tax=Lepraria neglecta TaxID=209136 RepID=A0AAD9YWA8_9LECA|nr:hypothetical protein OEA41_010291 [Lepraria neglecta]
MFSRSLRRACLQLPSPNVTLPPTFLFPLRAHLTTSTTTTEPKPPESAFNHLPLKQTPTYTIPTPSQPPPLPRKQPHLSTRSPLPPPTNQNLDLLPLLVAQPPHYILAHIHSRPYLLTMGDMLRLPFHMPLAPPGTVLRLNRASMLGSRDYTYRGDPWVDESRFLLRVVVVGVEGEPLRVVEKTKRRNRRVRRVKTKGRFTVLRVSELRVVPEGETVQGKKELEGDELEEDVEALVKE